MDSSAPAPTIVRCPSCGGPSIYAAGNAYRPFCSERCKTNDLSAWASERYAVPDGNDPARQDSSFNDNADER